MRGLYPRRQTPSPVRDALHRAHPLPQGERGFTVIAATSNQCFNPNKSSSEMRRQSMHVKDKVCVVTGAASGIGEAVARAWAAAGARGVGGADLKSSRDRLCGGGGGGRGARGP